MELEEILKRIKALETLAGSLKIENAFLKQYIANITANQITTTPAERDDIILEPLHEKY